MKHSSRISLLISLFIATSLVLSGCGQLEMGLETSPTPETAASATNLPASQSTATEPPAELPTVTPTAEAQVGAPTSSPDPRWMVLRDARYGYGLAVPCWWQIIPTPSEGQFATMTIKSYDEAYFQANSIKGEWIGGDYPAGALKMDLVVIEGVEPTLSTEEAARKALTNEESAVAYAQERTLGSHNAVLIDTYSIQNPASTQPVYVLRLAPDKLLVINVLPQRSLTERDVQGILESVALTEQESVTLPGFPPGDPLGDASSTCAATPVP